MRIYARCYRVWHDWRLALLTLLVGYLAQPSSPFSHTRLSVGRHTVTVDAPLWALKVEGGLLLVTRQPMPFAVQLPRGA